MSTHGSLLAPAELANLLHERPATRLLDVRSPAEFETEHIAGAYNVPLDTLGEHGSEIRAHVTDDVVIVCRSGQRALRAEQALASAGDRVGAAAVHRRYLRASRGADAALSASHD